MPVTRTQAFGSLVTTCLSLPGRCLRNPRRSRTCTTLIGIALVGLVVVATVCYMASVECPECVGYNQMDAARQGASMWNMFGW